MPAVTHPLSLILHALLRWEFCSVLAACVRLCKSLSQEHMRIKISCQ